MVKRILYLMSLVWLTVAMVGCGGSAEIKPQTTGGGMTPEQKKAVDEQMKKSMERSGYGQRGGPAPGTR